MEAEIARLLIANLLERLSREENHFHLPGGRLSESEIIALKTLAGVSFSIEDTALPPSSAKSAAPTLDLSALSRSELPEEDIRLCLDFGTAMSKAWASGTETVSYTHLRAHETGRNLVCRLLL